MDSTWRVQRAHASSARLLSDTPHDCDHALGSVLGEGAAAQVVGANEQHEHGALVAGDAPLQLPVREAVQEVLRLVAADAQHERRVAVALAEGGEGLGGALGALHGLAHGQAEEALEDGIAHEHERPLPLRAPPAFPQRRVEGDRPVHVPLEGAKPGRQLLVRRLPHALLRARRRQEGGFPAAGVRRAGLVAGGRRAAAGVLDDEWCPRRRRRITSADEEQHQREEKEDREGREDGGREGRSAVVLPRGIVGGPPHGIVGGPHTVRLYNVCLRIRSFYFPSPKTLLEAWFFGNRFVGQFGFGY